MTLFERIAFLGVFLPILGIAATFLLAWSCKSASRRWTILVLGPALIFLVFIAFFEPIAEVGSLLAVVMLAGLVVFVFCYYPVLMLVALIIWWKGR